MSQALSRIDEVRASLTRMTPQFKAALPAHIAPDKFVRVALTALQTNPKLLSADSHSLYGELMKCASDGLIPDGREAALLTFRSKDGKEIAKYIPMTAGLLKKVRNSGELASITAQVVYEQDHFRYFIDADGEHLEHEPNFFSDRGNILGVYALAKTKDDGVYIEVMTTAEVMAIRNVSRAKDSGPWAGDFALEMFKKSAIRRLSKRLPMSTDLDTTLRRDDDLIELTPERDATPAADQTKLIAESKGELKSKPKQNKPSKLAKAIQSQAEAKNFQPAVENQEPAEVQEQEII